MTKRTSDIDWEYNMVCTKKDKKNLWDCMVDSRQYAGIINFEPIDWPYWHDRYNNYYGLHHAIGLSCPTFEQYFKMVNEKYIWCDQFFVPDDHPMLDSFFPETECEETDNRNSEDYLINFNNILNKNI